MINGRAGGGLLRAVVPTSPRRSALLLTFSFAFLVCELLGFAGARTALAQAGNTQTPAQNNGGAAPPAQLQATGPSLTGYCVSTDSERSITLKGTGFTPGTYVLFYQDGAQLRAKDTDGYGVVTDRYDSPSYVPGTTV